jgi:hypothetical protein
MATKGCFVCGSRIDKFYIMATPDGKKYKLCGRCMKNLMSIAKNSKFENVENVEEEQ